VSDRSLEILGEGIAGKSGVRVGPDLPRRVNFSIIYVARPDGKSVNEAAKVGCWKRSVVRGRESLF
jgi:hypothetical protein